MYEYVQTATGWVLCWGGEALYREPPQIVLAPDAAAEPLADCEPVQALSA